ncbi:MAG TPA: UMP kinase [Candidatus Saccharimonadales bacterium]|nr:UMP kinase [Candidatus Saccharimonadales bacterium]
MYKRILLKLSGEQLAGKFESGIDAELGHWLAGEVGRVVASGTQVVIMVGGGNYARGAQLAGHGIGRVTADNVGMLATMMNAIALADIFNAGDISARALTNIKADQVADQFTHRRAISDLAKGHVVIVAGGIGRPYLTTDTAAVSLALELDCEAVLKATKVDGVYDKDPAKHKDAVKVDVMSFDEAVSNGAIQVMDKAALGLAMEHKLPIVVFNALTEGSIGQVASGEAVGTRIS